MTANLHDVLINAAGAIAAFMFAAWLLSLVLKNASIADIVWGAGFVMTAWVTFFTVGHTLDLRQVLLLAISTFWGTRLSLHLFKRNRGKPEDSRYKAMRDKHPASFGWVSLVTVFGLQGVLMFLVSLPVQLGQLSPQTPFGLLAYLGVALCATGLFFEVVGDYQLAQFTKNPANHSKVMNKGLWRYTRHPNYFGDSCLWWGLALIAFDTAYGPWALIGPVVITFLLTKVSGIPMLEKAMLKSNPLYADYMAVTSAFVPWLPGKR